MSSIAPSSGMASTSSASGGCSAIAFGHSLRLVDRDQFVQQAIQITIEHVGQVVQVHVYAMVGYAVLREVVGTNFLRALARANHAPAYFGLGFMLLALLHLEKPGAQHR